MTVNLSSTKLLIMNYKAFPNEYWQKINQTIADLKAKSDQQLIAAFDADGTLWDTDLGENFFQYQIDNQQVELPHDPFNHYLEMKKINNDPRDAYVWLAQINQGKSLEQVRHWATDAFNSISPSPIFSEQKKLIELLLSHNVQIFIVTASIKWAVEPGARVFGLSDQNVIGVETVVKDAMITTDPIIPITYRAGKTEALLKKTGGQKPFLCSGNTIGDFELLQSASHIQLAVSAASRDDKLFKSESELITKAQQLNWWSHRFI